MEQNSRNIRKQLTRDKIIKSAMELFASTGFLSTSTLEIARNAGISHGTIFLHFPTKDNLILLVVERECTRLAKGTSAIIAGETSIKHVLAAHIDLLIENELLYSSIVSELHLLPNKARTTFVAWQSAISHHFSIVAEIEREANRIKQVPDFFLFNSWIGLLHHYLLNKSLFSPNKPVLERYRNELLSNFSLLLDFSNSNVSKGKTNG